MDDLSDEDKRTAQFIKACQDNYSRAHGFNQAAEAVLFLLNCLQGSESDLAAARAVLREVVPIMKGDVLFAALAGHASDGKREDLLARIAAALGEGKETK